MKGVYFPCCERDEGSCQVVVKLGKAMYEVRHTGLLEKDWKNVRSRFGVSFFFARKPEISLCFFPFNGLLRFFLC